MPAGLVFTIILFNLFFLYTFANMAYYVLLRQFSRYADGVFNRLGFRASMADNKASVYAEKRRAAVLCKIKTFF